MEELQNRESVEISTFFNDFDISDVMEIEDKVISSGINLRDEINSKHLMHHLVNGMYCRILTLPKGTFATGKVHKEAYLDMFISGDLTLKSFLDNAEESTRRINSPCIMKGVPGRKRVVYAHSDSVWMTVDRTKVVNLGDAENDSLVFSLDDYAKIKEVI